MVLRICLQPEMAQGFDDKRRLVAYRYAIDRLYSRSAIHYRARKPVSWAGDPCACPAGVYWAHHARDRSERKPRWRDPGRPRLRVNLYPGYVDLRSRRFWSVHLHIE